MYTNLCTFKTNHNMNLIYYLMSFFLYLFLIHLLIPPFLQLHCSRHLAFIICWAWLVPLSSFHALQLLCLPGVSTGVRLL